MKKSTGSIVESYNPIAPDSLGEYQGARKRVQRRQTIIETAARLFAAEGFTGCEMERVASEIGIAKGTLYLYFPTKRELFFACVDGGMSRMQELVREAAERESDPLERIQQGVLAYLKFFDSHPEYVELLIQERANFRDRKKPTYFEHREANLSYWRQQWQSLIDDGRLRSDVPLDRVTDFIGSLMYGTMFINQFIGRNIPLDEQYQMLMTIVLGGLLRRP